MSKLWYRVKGMSCCGKFTSSSKPVIEVVGQSTLKAERPNRTWVCKVCCAPLPNDMEVLISSDKDIYAKSMYKPFDDEVQDEVFCETNERSESLPQMSLDLGCERSRTAVVQE